MSMTQIDEQRRDPHGATTQLDRFPIFASHQLVVLKSLHWVLRSRLECILR
jgi:hypothetical protein